MTDQQGPALPWKERVTMLSINPDAATRDDVASLADELIIANHKVARAEEAERWAEKLAKILIPLWEWASDCDYINDPNRTHKECDCPLCVSRKFIYEYAVWKKSRE
jgi:hypothetical protein